ncbi:hypothetical protein L0222_11905 [bacterium]|nr:hypothetical protein [bacterium]
MRVYSYVKMTAEEIYIKLKDELTADNESSSSPERIFIKSEGQTICTLGMNRSHEIIFVEFKPAPKDLSSIENQPFVHPHPVEMLHDAGWRQAQLTSWEEAEKLLEIINRSYKKKKSRLSDDAPRPMKKVKQAVLEAIRAVERPKGKATAEELRRGKLKMLPAKPGKKQAAPPPPPKKEKAKKAKPVSKAKPKKAQVSKATVKAKPKAKAAPKKSKPAKKKKK